MLESAASHVSIIRIRPESVGNDCGSGSDQRQVQGLIWLAGIFCGPEKTFVITHDPLERGSRNRGYIAHNNGVRMANPYSEAWRIVNEAALNCSGACGETKVGYRGGAMCCRDRVTIQPCPWAVEHERQLYRAQLG